MNDGVSERHVKLLQINNSVPGVIARGRPCHIGIYVRKLIEIICVGIC